MKAGRLGESFGSSSTGAVSTVASDSQIPSLPLIQQRQWQPSVRPLTASELQLLRFLQAVKASKK